MSPRPRQYSSLPPFSNPHSCDLSHCPIHAPSLGQLSSTWNQSSFHFSILSYQQQRRGIVLFHPRVDFRSTVLIHSQRCPPSGFPRAKSTSTRYTYRLHAGTCLHLRQSITITILLLHPSVRVTNAAALLPIASFLSLDPPAISPRIAFTAMPFRYTQLPAELRMLVRKEAIYAIPRGSRGHQLAIMAVVDAEWQRDVEFVTFRRLKLEPGDAQVQNGTRRDDLSDFARIVVGERRKYVKYLGFSIAYHDDCCLTDPESSVSASTCVLRSVQRVKQLLTILSGWSTEKPEVRSQPQPGNSCSKGR